jgi:hypothetical protein
VAQAHLWTGAPIPVHTNAQAQTGLTGQEILRSEGADLGAVVIGLSGDTSEPDYLHRLIDNGSYLDMDRFGLDVLLPTDQRVATVVTLIRQGAADRMVLSHDASCHIDWFPPASANRSHRTGTTRTCTTTSFQRCCKPGAPRHNRTPCWSTTNAATSARPSPSVMPHGAVRQGVSRRRGPTSWPRPQTANVGRPEAEQRARHRDARLTPGPALPGFTPSRVPLFLPVVSAVGPQVACEL